MSIAYRPEIDGLRAIAVIPVVLFHAGFPAWKGGFVGVDVFFVISGFLISSIILTDLEAGRFSITRFWERRARRILPALLLVTLASVLVSWFFLTQTQLRDFGESVSAVATFSSNIHFRLESGYFDSAAEMKPLLHTWSLAVEEQFYIVFPLILWGLWRLHRWAAGVGMVVLASMSLIGAQNGLGDDPDAVFFLLPARMWELLVGVLIAIYLRSPQAIIPRRWLAEASCLLGIGMIGFAVFYFDDSIPFPGVAALIPTLGTALILFFARPDLLSSRILQWRPFVGLGLISFGLYLWHQPLFAYLRHGFLGAPVPAWAFWLAIVASFALSWASYAFVEKPMRYSKRLSTRGVLIVALISLGSLYGLGWLITQPQAKSLLRVERHFNYLDYRIDNQLLKTESWSELRLLAGNADYGVAKNKFDNHLWFDDDGNDQKILVIGNSHAKDVFNILTRSKVVTDQAQVARFGTQIADIDPRLWQSPNFLAANTILIATAFGPNDLSELDAVVKRILAVEKSVYIMRPFPSFPGSGDYTLADKMALDCLRNVVCDRGTFHDRVNSAYFDHYSTVGSNSNVVAINSELDRLVEKIPAITLIGRADYICDDTVKRCLGMTDDWAKTLYDTGHHTIAGAQAFATRADLIGLFLPLVEGHKD